MIFGLNVTSQSVTIQIVDDAGLPVTGLVAATFPTLVYNRAGANADVAFPTLSDLATITTAWAAGGLKERTGGYYRLDVPDAIFTAAGQVRVRGEATGKRVLCTPLDVAVTVNTLTGYVAPLDAAGVRAAMGLGSANLDTQLAALDADVLNRASATASPSWYAAPPSAAAVADTTLRRQMSNVEASANGDALSKSSLYGSVQAQQKSSVSGTTLTVLKTDGTTLGTFTLTVSAGASPVTGVA